MKRLKGLSKSVIGNLPSSEKKNDPFSTALKITKSATEAEAKAKESEDKEGGSRWRLQQLSSVLEAIFKERSETLVDSWRTAMEGQDPRDLEEFEYALASSFDRVSATTLEKVDQFADEEAKAVRKAVKQAAIDNGLKLERVRTASNVSLKNQQAELQAEFDRTLEAKILSLSEGGDAVLREATKRLQDASEELAELKTKHSSQEEQLKMARKELEASKKMIAQAAEAQEALKECFLVLKLSPTEEKVLEQQLRSSQRFDLPGLPCFFRCQSLSSAAWRVSCVLTLPQVLLTAIKELHAAACGVVQSNDEERTEMEKKNAALEQQLVKAAADADTALAQRDEQVTPAPSNT